MPHFSWTRASYVMFGFAVFAALIKLWSPDVSSPASFAAEKRAADTPRISTKTVEGPGAETRETPTSEVTPPKRESFVRHTLEIPDAKESAARDPETPLPGDESPVFYRPASRVLDGGRPPESGPVCGDLGDFPTSSRAVFPLQDDYFYSYDDTWGAPRPQGGHEGTDLMTPSGVPEYAITAGTVVPVSGSKQEGWNTLGGYTVMVRADYDIGPIREGDLFYYAHLNERSTLPVGAKVRAGQVVGYSGDTGQGPEVTRGLFPPHLHLGWYDGGGDRSDLESGAMNPYPLLEWLKRNGGSVVGGSGAEYCEAPRAGDSPAAERWTTPGAPGKTPDLNTGTEDPRPSPIVKKRTTVTHTAGDERKERPNRVAAQRRGNSRTIPQRASVAGKNVPAHEPRSSASTKNERRADRPAPPEPARVSRGRPAQAENREDQPPAGLTREETGKQRNAKPPPKKTDTRNRPETERSEKPEKPNPSEEGGCGAGCPAEPDDPRTPGERPETTTPEPETTQPVDGAESDSVAAAAPSGGKDGVPGGEIHSIP